MVARPRVWKSAAVFSLILASVSVCSSSSDRVVKQTVREVWVPETLAGLFQ